VIAPLCVRGFLPQGFSRKNSCLIVSFISRYYLTSGIQSQVSDTRFLRREIRVTSCTLPQASLTIRRSVGSISMIETDRIFLVRAPVTEIDTKSIFFAW